MEDHLLNECANEYNPTPELTTYGGIKLGWIQGVLVPCLLNIWGVMLFLRIAWIVAQAGIGLTLLIILISAVVCVITTLSLSAICTNGDLKGGGVYYLVSRSLGAEMGASVGIIFAFANAVAASMNTIGFCDSLNDLLRNHGTKIIDNGVNDVRIIGAIALFVMCVICAIGMDWETKTQNFLIVTIVLAIFNYIIGSFVGPKSDDEKVKGFVGFSFKTLLTNWGPNYRFSEGVHHDFFSVFAVYFPAVTGVQAGANICGDLRNPATAIPKGTLTAVGISTSSYVIMAVLSGSGALRDASGDSADAATCVPNCQYGLHNNYEIMQLMALWGPLIYAGCWAATLSTALTNLLSVPRLIQALGIDRIYPGLIFFSKPFGKHGEPYRGYVLTFSVSLVFLLIANLNMIAPLITNFYLASYALINFCTFHAAFIKHISWRPTFRWYNTWLSFVGFVLCLVIMMIISWPMTLITVAIFLTLYLVVLYRKPEANWGSSTEAQRYIDTVNTILSMEHRIECAKTYNPQLLILAGNPYDRPALVYIGILITNAGSFMIAADVIKEHLTSAQLATRQGVGEQWLRTLKSRGFYVTLDSLDFETGAQVLMKTTGLGRMAPNVLLLGYKNRWCTAKHEEIRSYVNIIHFSKQVPGTQHEGNDEPIIPEDRKGKRHLLFLNIRNAFDNQLAVTILRVPSTARPIHKARQGTGATRTKKSQRFQNPLLAILGADSSYDIASPSSTGEDNDKTEADDERSLRKFEMSNEEQKPEKDSEKSPYIELSFQQDDVLDAWWLCNEGGLNILLPYIIAKRGMKDKLRLRIFALARSDLPTTKARNQLQSLLSKFRINYESLIILESADEEPETQSWELFDSIIKDFRSPKDDDVMISDDQLTRERTRTARYLRVRELLMMHSSSQAALVVITLPFPKKTHGNAQHYSGDKENVPLGIITTNKRNKTMKFFHDIEIVDEKSPYEVEDYDEIDTPAALQMSWLEVLSRDLPPVLFVRGNNTPVLTTNA